MKTILVVDDAIFMRKTIRLILEKNGYRIATQLRPATVFWPAEEYHQDYYELKGTLPYCHSWTKRF